jgi:hypothetical protein
MQIASIRNSLEKGLAVSTEMTEEMGSLEVWLEQSETELKGSFPDKEAELNFLRVRTSKLNLTHMSTSYKKICSL